MFQFILVLVKLGATIYEGLKRGIFRKLGQNIWSTQVFIK